MTARSLSAQDTTVTFKVFGACGMCEDRIEAAARGRGVSAADWEVATNMLTVNYDASKTQLDRIKKRIVEVGHDLEDQKAPDAVYEKLPDCCLYRDMEKTGHALPESPAKDTTVTIKVFGACGMCEDRIEAAAKGRGVSAADWEVTSNMLTLQFNPAQTSLTSIEDRILEVGHDLVDRKAPDAVYEKLPECCLYRDMEKTGHALPVAEEAPQASIGETVEESISADGKMATARFKVFGACGMCEDRIETAVKGRGVSTADWDVNTGMLTVVYSPDKTELARIQDRILEVGHDLVDRKAPDAVYEKLPDCCLYRDMEKTGHAPLEWQTNPDAELQADNNVRGVVMRSTLQGEFTPLPAVSIYWQGAEGGTTTNEDGVFSIPRIAGANNLVVSHAGLIADTITINDNRLFTIVMEENNSGRLQEVVVTSRRLSSFVSTASAIRMQTMTEQELFKAACCNLSESFETNPSVDVSFNDAITGTKQIQLLGLSGNYTQLTLENLPGPRGLATPLGLNFIPGPWVESIQLTKGIGSVANGFESIAGQINIEMKKPEGDQKLFANVYLNDMAKGDVNLNLATHVSDKWSTALLMHYDFLYNQKVDFNQDGFRDLPTGHQYNIINRWRYDNGKGFMMQFGGH